MKTLEYLINFEGKICLIAHSNPDPDCIGSMLALYNYLNKFNKDVIMISKDEPIGTIKYLKGFDKIIRLGNLPETDLYVLIDQSEVERSGINPEEFKDKNIIKIDHHITNKKYSEYDYIDENAPSTTSLMLELMRNYNEELIDENIAECIFVGLSADTGNFSFSNLKVAFENALYLANRGFNINRFSEKFLRNQSINRMELIRLALSTLRYEDNIGYIIIRKKFYEISGAKKYENYGIVDIPLSLSNVKVALKFEEMENGWKVNLRSKENIDVQKFAEKHNGGGHKNASAFRINEKIPESELIERIIEDLKNYLKTIHE
ncbi:MAG: bifunctional oligoribonuclease/PAP phosphatase NrnA [candidate division WOR-3 bacterium]|nr:bifunctional oligoribonuclease/PAP phosphatase NrnA [candidate division WOR-3 bacterium]